MERFLCDAVARLKPYTPGEQPVDRKYIKLNTNENPYPPSPAVIEAVRASAGPDLRLYPQPECHSLREAIAASDEAAGLNKDNIYISNGSDEMLAFAFLAFFKKDRPLLFPDITYSFYESYCALYDIAFQTIPLDSGFNIVPEDYCGKVRAGGIIFPNPNAPTSKILGLDAIRTILKANPECVVILDEAYIDFASCMTGPAAALVSLYPNLLIIRTFSKSRCLAGLRIGYALGQPHLIGALAAIKNSFNSYVMDRVALAAAEAAVRDPDYYAAVNGAVVRTRERITADMRSMGFDVAESSANFIFASHPDLSGECLFTALKDRGILVRHFNKPRISNHLRISIGTDAEMDILTDSLKTILKDSGPKVGGPKCGAPKVSGAKGSGRLACAQGGNTAEVPDGTCRRGVTGRGNKVAKIRNYYSERRKESEDCRRLGWESRQAHEGRFETLVRNIRLDGRKILDVGCGFGNLYGFLEGQGIKADYTGVDILEEMTLEAGRRFGNDRFMCLDIFSGDSFREGEFDVVYTSGIFNIDLGNNREFLICALKKFFSLASEAVCFNLLDPDSPEREEGYYCLEPCEALKLALQEGPSGMSAKVERNPCSNDYTVICLMQPAKH